MIKKIFTLFFIFSICFFSAFIIESSEKSWENFTFEDGLVSNNFKSVFEDSEGNIWCISYARGVSKFDGMTWTNYKNKDGLISNIIDKFMPDSKGNIWFFGLKLRFCHYDGTRMIKGPKIFVQTIFEDSHKDIWLGSWGLYNYKDPDNFIRYSKKEGLAGNSITAIFEDIKGILWVGTKNGISRYDGQNWVTYNEDNGATSKTVSVILEDKKGNIWFGTYGGVFQFDGQDWISFTKEDEILPTNDVLLMKMDSQGNIWVTLGGHSKEWGLLSIGSDLVHKSGILKYDGENWTSFSAEEGAPDAKIIKMEIDSKDNIWCDTYTTGFYLYDGAKWTKYSKEEGFYANHFYEFEEDSDGHIWLATGSGLLFYDGSEWTQYTIEDGLPGDRVLSVIEDSRGDIWIATGGGVGRYKR